MIKIYKFIMIIIILLGVIFVLVSCSNGSWVKNNSLNSDSVISSTDTGKPVIGSTVIIGNDIDLKENASNTSNTIIKLYKGNIVKVMDLKNPWASVQAVCFVPPASKGYIPIDTIITDFRNVTPNQGFIIGTVCVLAKPNNKSEISATDVTGAVSIFKRENGWAYCRFVGGLEDGWIKESEIQYNFPIN